MKKEAVAKQLRDIFERNGHVRRQDPVRVAEEGWERYRKGDEVRLGARSAAELRRVRRLLGEAGFKAGRAYVQGRQYRQPVYGREQVERFLELIGE